MSKQPRGHNLSPIPCKGRRRLPPLLRLLLTTIKLIGDLQGKENKCKKNHDQKGGKKEPQAG